MKYLKKYKSFSINEMTETEEKLIRSYGDDFFINSQEDIEYVKEILIGLEDLDYLVMINYTPVTFLNKMKSLIRKSEYKPQIYIKIDHFGSDEFYGDLGERKDDVEYYLSRSFKYLESKGWVMELRDEVFFNKFSKFIPTSHVYKFAYDI